MKILVVDDNATNRKYLRVLLMQAGHAVLEAEDGLEALNTLERENIDAVISDVLMPRMDGYRLCYEIRKNPKLNSIPFIAYSATFTSPHDEQVALDFGADRFLAKPALPEVIIKALHEAVEKRGSRTQQNRAPDELSAMKEYSETLVRKLEDTNAELAGANTVLNERAVLAEFIADISNALNYSETLPVILQLCTEAMVRRLNAAFARIWTYNLKDHVLELQASAGMYTHINGGHGRVTVGQFKIGLIASERKPHWTNSVIGDPRVNDQVWAKREGMVSFAGYPLIAEERLVGVMAMFGKKPFSPNTLDAMASVANGIALGIERKLTENKLHDSEERFRELAENIREIFYIAGPHGSPVHYVSPAFDEITGRSRKGFEGNPGFWLELIHPDDRGRVEQAHRAAPEALDIEYRSMRPDGSIRWLHTRSFPVRDEAGTIVRIVGIAEDITDRKRAEEKVHQHLERIRALHEIDTAISSTLDLHTILSVLLEKLELFLPIARAATVRLLNRETGELESLACRGLDENEWKLQPIKTLAGRAKRIVETKAPLAVRNIQNDPRTYNAELFAKHTLVSYLGVPLVAKEEVLGVLGLYTSEEHEFTDDEVEFLMTLAGQAAIAIHNAQLYSETDQSKKDLEKAVKVKDEFLSVVSHELKTPLIVLMEYANVLKDGIMGKVNEDQGKALVKLLGAADEQLKMINMILQTTQLESRTLSSEHQIIEVRDLLRGLQAEYETRSIAKAVMLRWNYPAEPMEMITDSVKLEQILRNLIDNAIKFTDHGSVTISADNCKQNRAVEFSVADTGIGIAKVYQHTIFDKLYQVESSDNRRYEGIGLGLYIVKKFSDLIGATLEVKSDLGIGATFTVSVPWR